MWNRYIGEVSRFDRVVIYGAGQIGKKVLDIIERVNMRDKVICFAVTKTDHSLEMVNDIPVRNIDEIIEEYDNALFLLSVGDRFMYELEQVVISKGIRHYFDGRKVYKEDFQGAKEQGHIEVNINELFMQQYKNGVFNRMDIVVRFLAIENYYGINDFGFDLYRKMQAQRISDLYVENAVEKFRSLIASWEQKGYLKKSEIECDRNLHLMDGAHRIAMGLYYGVDGISCKVNPYADDIDYGMDWFIEHGFEIKEIILIKEKFEELYKRICGSISCVLWPAVYEYYDEITQKIRMLYKIKSVKDYHFNEITFEKAVRGIYYIDDIDSWKIDKKIEFLKSFPSKTIRVIELNIPKPKFRLKSANYHTILTEGEKLKRIFRNCYKKYVDNYIYDVIMHTGDNYEQSEYILNLFEQDFSLIDYFGEIARYKWIAIKTDSPAMPDDFPQTYPFSKDIDIICADEDYKLIIGETVNFLDKTIGGMRKISVISGEKKTKIRVEQKGYLIFHFDIARQLPGMEDEFLKHAVEQREYLNGYYVPDKGREVIFRIYECLNHPTKEQHFDYIKRNGEFLDLEQAMKALPGYTDEIIGLYRRIFDGEM